MSQVPPSLPRSPLHCVWFSLTVSICLGHGLLSTLWTTCNNCISSYSFSSVSVAVSVCVSVVCVCVCNCICLFRMNEIHFLEYFRCMERFTKVSITICKQTAQQEGLRRGTEREREKKRGRGQGGDYTREAEAGQTIQQVPCAWLGGQYALSSLCV